MKRLYIFFIILFLFINISTVHAKDKIIGEVLSTDIVVFIDSQPILSYNIQGKTYIVAEDLIEHSFKVDWNETERTLSITLEHEGQRGFLDKAEINQLKENTNIGTPLYSVYSTDIKTYIAQNPVNAYNINGKTLIAVSDLSFYGDIEWSNRQINVKIRPKWLKELWETAKDKQMIYLVNEDNNKQQYIGQIENGKPNGIGKVITDEDDGMATYHDEEYGRFIDGVRDGEFYKSGKRNMYTGSNHLGDSIYEEYSTYKNDKINGFSSFIFYDSPYHGNRIEGFFKDKIKNGLYRYSEFSPDYKYGFVIEEEGIYLNDELQDFKELEIEPKFKYVYSDSSFISMIDEQDNLYIAGDAYEFNFNRPRFYKVSEDVKQIHTFSIANIIKTDNSLYRFNQQTGEEDFIAKNVVHAEEDWYLTEDGILYNENGMVTDHVKQFIGSYRILMLKDDNSVYYMIPQEDLSMSEPVKIMDDIIKIASDGLTQFMLKEDGSLWGIGFNTACMLFDGKSIRDNSDLQQQSEQILEYEFAQRLQVPVVNKPICIMENVKEVYSSGGNMVAIIDNQNNLFAWGDNSDNRLLTEPEVEFLSTPKFIMSDVQQVSIGVSHGAVIKTDGTLWVWGSNKDGRLGIGDKDVEYILSPVQVKKVYEFVN